MPDYKNTKCVDCGKLIWQSSTRCKKCSNRFKPNPTRGRKRTLSELEKIKETKRLLFSLGLHGTRKGQRAWNKGLTKDTDERIAQLARNTSKGHYKWHKIHGCRASTREAMRKAALKRIVELGGPTVGRAEKEILDRLEKQLGHKIRRQHLVSGYSIDGFIPELNLAVEIDEAGHFVSGKLSEKDVIRQKNIEQLLHCQFLRIRV